MRGIPSSEQESPAKTSEVSETSEVSLAAALLWCICAAIFIRNVTGETADNPRFRSARQGVPPQRWRLFDSPRELEAVCDELTKEHAWKPAAP